MPWPSPLPLVDDGARDIRLTATTADVLPDAATAFGQRVRARLQNDTVIWIVTVGADGRPQPNPVGFCRDGGADSTEFVIYSRPDSHGSSTFVNGRTRFRSTSTATVTARTSWCCAAGSWSTTTIRSSRTDRLTSRSTALPWNGSSAALRSLARATRSPCASRSPGCEASTCGARERLTVVATR